MSIRTTVSLDEDVYERVKEASRRFGKPFRQMLNEVARSGLATVNALPKRRLVIKPFNMGIVPGLDYNDIEGLISFAEGEDHR